MSAVFFVFLWALRFHSVVRFAAEASGFGRPHRGVYGSWQDEEVRGAEEDFMISCASSASLPLLGALPGSLEQLAALLLHPIPLRWQESDEACDVRTPGFAGQSGQRSTLLHCFVVAHACYW